MKSGKVGKCGILACSFILCTLCQNEGIICSHYLESSQHYMTMCLRALRGDYKEEIIVQEKSGDQLLDQNLKFFENNFSNIEALLGKGVATNSLQTSRQLTAMNWQNKES